MGDDALVVELLPARQGDAVVLEWGPGEKRRRMLVDGGPAIAYEQVSGRLADLCGDDPLELLVLTHIDGDHIEGFVLLTNDSALGVGIEEIWFNGPAQLGELGVAQGEFLGAIIQTRGIGWNTRFGHRAVAPADDGELPMRELPGGLRLTVLGPSRSQLLRLRDKWVVEAAAAGLAFGSVEDALRVLRGRSRLVPAQTYLSRAPAPNITKLANAVVSKDTALANSTSIVLLAEYGDARVLLAGDATPDALLPAVRRLLIDRGLDRLPLSAFKLPHHGSARNVTTELVRLLPAERYLFSSDGSYFSHPDDSAVARVIEHGPPGAELVFNYANPRTLGWDDNRLIDRYGYRLRYPDTADGGVATTLPPRPES